jgi:hypothetical protein
VSSSRHSRRRIILGALACAVALAALLLTPAQAAFSDYALESVEDSLTTPQGGAHPNFITRFELTKETSGEPFAQTRDLNVAIPPGLVGNPQGFPKCTTLQLGIFPEASHCPQDSQVGVTEVTLYPTGTFTEPIYIMAPSGGDIVARLGLFAGPFPALINVRVRPKDYGLTASVEGPASAGLVGATTTLWGIPADSSHDALRITPLEAQHGEGPPGGGRKSGLPPAPFMSNPTSCGTPRQITFSADSYQLPGQFSTLSAPLPEISGCGKLGFEPKLAVTPTASEAAAPTGLDAELTIPQDETPKGLAASQLRDAIVTLPQGMTIAPGAADGLQACSAQQVGFEEAIPSNCPDAAKIGSAELNVPALERVLQGAVYQRSPEAGHLFRIWLTTDELGVHVKIAGEIRLDPTTGQVTSLFLDNPQVPFEALKLHFFGGPRAPLATPTACGIYQTHFSFSPWSGNPAVVGDTPMQIDQGCNTGGFSPKLSGGTANPSAGFFSSFVTNLTRESGEQNISGLDVTLPPGVLAKLAGISLCEGVAATGGDCPTASHVGATAVATGPGPAPLWIPQPGKVPTAVYLSGPYKGAPYSLVVKTPAQAGPFDLGTVVVRAAIHIDPETAQVTVKSDPLPQILEGVPISYRTIHIDVNRPNFTLNPTNCDPLSTSAVVSSGKGTLARPSDGFQATNCARLGFKPKLGMRLHGKTNRGAHPRFQAVLETRKGDANIAKAQVALSHSEFLDQSHIRTVCTRVQFAAGQCPTGSIYGHAKAISPLLDRPLEGPVYLRSSSHLLPDLLVALRGQVDVNLVGRIDSIHGGIRTTFEAVPDAPVTKFAITMQGGKKGLLVNSRNLCEAPLHSVVELVAQNGKTADQRPRMQDDCGKAHQEVPPKKQ